MSEALEPSRPASMIIRGIDQLMHVAALQTIGRMGRRLPPEEKVRLIRNVPYVNDGKRSHLLDVWLPAPYPGLSPMVIYIHGGGFAVGSKDTHRIAGRQFARRGCVTFMLNYRLAPKHPYPSSLEDVCRGVIWAWEHAHHYGADPSRVIIAGESAGGNLTTMMALINSFRRHEPFAREVFDRNIPVKGVIPWCGWYYLSDHQVYAEHRVVRYFLPLLKYLSSIYAGLPPEAESIRMDPLTHPLEILASKREPDRPLPPFFIPIGTNDPLFFDSKRLRDLLVDRDIPVKWKVYPGEHHGFHVMPFMPRFRECWHDVSEFLDELGVRDSIKSHAVAGATAAASRKQGSKRSRSRRKSRGGLLGDFVSPT